MPTAILAVMAGILGVLVGGVINALADDLPEQERVRLPHYPDGSPRPVRAWLGLSAFALGLRDGPKSTQVDPDEEGAVPPVRSNRLGWRHPLAELTLGLGYLVLVLAFRDEPALLAWLIYVAILALITIIDLEHRLILFVVIVPSCLFALLVAVISPQAGRSFQEYVWGGVLGFLLFLAMFLGGAAFSTVLGRDEVAFGFGDVMLATLSGLMLGWRAFIFAALITVVAGAVGSLLYIVSRAVVGRRYRLFTPLPYGPYIVLGTLVMLLFRDEVRHFLQTTAY